MMDLDEIQGKADRLQARLRKAQRLVSRERSDAAFKRVADLEAQLELVLELAASLRREQNLRSDVEAMRGRKDGAYLERNRVVALVARMALAMGLRAGVARTDIPGWNEHWNGCVYVDLPTGQCSWHFHDDQAFLFEGLPDYEPEYDGHETPEKYARVHEAFQDALATTQGGRA